MLAPGCSKNRSGARSTDDRFIDETALTAISCWGSLQPRTDRRRCVRRCLEDLSLQLDQIPKRRSGAALGPSPMHSSLVPFGLNRSDRHHCCVSATLSRSHFTIRLDDDRLGTLGMRRPRWPSMCVTLAIRVDGPQLQGRADGPFRAPSASSTGGFSFSHGRRRAYLTRGPDKHCRLKQT